MRGYWWSPDGRSLLVARVDDAPVRRWYIADPANPDREPTVVAYPAAGTPNALVSLVVVGLDGTRVDVAWDAGRDEYLAHAVWSAEELLIVVQPRDQRALRVLQVDPATGATTLVHEDTDRHWVEIVPGVPARTASGALLWITDDGAARRLLVDWRAGHPTDPPGPRRARRRRGHRAARRLRRPGLDRAVDLVRRGRPAVPHPGARCARRAAGRRDPRREQAVARRRRHGHHRPAGGRDRADGHVVRRAARVDPPDHACTGPASGRCAPRCCSRRGTSRGRRCRCSWTPTAARTPSASSPRAART